jgi:large subunit ribosomal protein L10
MAKPTKVATVAEIADSFRSSSAAVITEYRGLTMSQLTTLRKNLGSDTAYTVAKNTLVKRAAADAGVEGLDGLFTGPTAVAFISGEPVDAAKVLRDFSRANPLLVIKGGVLDGKPLDAAEVTKLADLESREVLLGKMAGAMLATLTKAAVVLNALPSQVARLAAALVEKRTEDEGAPEPSAAPEATDAVETVDGETDSSAAAAEPAESAAPETASAEA